MKTLVLDSHQLSQYQRCEKYYELRTVQNLDVEPRTSFLYNKETKLVQVLLPPISGLDIGTFWHKILNLYYLGIQKKKNKTKVVLAIIKWIQKNRQLDQQQKDFTCKRFIEYVGRWPEDQVLNILGTEVGFSTTIYQDAEHLFIYEGRIDLIYELTTRNGESPKVAFRDFKTEAFKYDIFKHTNQFLGYAWALKTNLGEIDVIGLQKTLPPQESMFRIPLFFSDQQIEQWKEITIQWYFRILKSVESKDFLPNPNHHQTQFGLCKFFDYCINGKIDNLVVTPEWRPW